MSSSSEDDLTQWSETLEASQVKRPLVRSEAWPSLNGINGVYFILFVSLTAMGAFILPFMLFGS